MMRGVFFDAHGVLYDRHESTGRFAARLVAERGCAPELPTLEKERLKAFNTAASTGRISAEAYWDEFLRAHGVATEGERASLIKNIMEHAHQVFPLPGVAATLAALKQRGVILGIITDTMYPLEWKMAWLAKAGVAEFVDALACSTVVGARKPDEAIYLDAVSRARLTPAEAAFVGHDARELEGARRAGMLTVAVNHDPEARADYYARSLPDLLTLPIFQPGRLTRVTRGNLSTDVDKLE